MLMFLKGKTMFASVATSTMTIRHVQTQSTLDRLVETIRQALRGLDDRCLADIGLSAIQADAEANRPFWDVPSTWRR